jgi:membrane-bound lytic murein transglycosylase D
MLKRALIILFSFSSILAKAQVQPPQVPNKMEFAGIELKIDNDARELIQASVISLTKSPKYFQVKVERANIYFPLVEKILKEEGVPDDFKYLVLQESALMADAVSSSNAVGYWQFKKESAGDVDVLVNGDVDERMHIVAATRGAARYIKKNNLYLSNWLNALLSYNTGLGGVKLLVGPDDINATFMKITGTTHVYVLKFLAHKIAFENALNITPPQHSLVEYRDCTNKTLKEVAEEVGVAEEDLAKYNIWLKTKKIPGDKRHTVIVPATEQNYGKLMAMGGEKENLYLVKSEARTNASIVTRTTKENGLKAVIAGNGETVESLSKKGGISKSKFLRFNEMGRNESIIAGQVYYLETKNNKAAKDYHVAQENESFWSVSQRYGIKKSRLLKFNRIGRDEELKVGRVLWIAETRPIIVPVEIKSVEKPASKEIVKEALYAPKKETVPETVRVAKSEEREMFPDEFYDDDRKSSVAAVSTPFGKTTNSTENKGSKMHTVIKGDTFYSISKLYGVQIDDLKKWNGMDAQSPLKIGQVMVIKTEESSSTGKENSKSGNFITYTVKSGDSIYAIARQYKVTIKELQTWNDKEDYTISVGEELKIYKN